MWEFLEGKTSLDETRLKAIAATRQLAKRQITWLRQFTKTWPGLISLDPQRDDPLPSVRDATQSWWHGRT
jgi:tRNA dimethylallyltransferase